MRDSGLVVLLPIKLLPITYRELIGFVRIVVLTVSFKFCKYVAPLFCFAHEFAADIFFRKCPHVSSLPRQVVSHLMTKFRQTEKKNSGYPILKGPILKDPILK